MKTPQKTSRFRPSALILVRSIAAFAVLGLALSASAQTHHWKAAAPGLLWSDAANWSAETIPGPGNTVRFELTGADAALGTIIMDTDYSASSIDFARFTGNEVVSIENYLKVTSTSTALQIQNGGSGASRVSVPAGGTIDGTVNLANEGSRTPPTLNFMGGDWVAGNVKTESGNRQGGILRVSSSTGTLTPGAVLVSLAPEPVANRARFHFDLDAAGVAPIAFQHATDPIQFTGAAAGTNPFNLTVEAEDYAGAGVDIPLITHTNDTNRLFSAGNITIANAPAGKGAFVTQTDTGTTLTLADAGDWDGDTDTSWATGDNWAGGTAPGASDGLRLANLPAGAPATLELNGTSPTLAVLTINSVGGVASDYSISQGSGGTINLGATPTGSAFAAAQINVLQGAGNTLSAPVALHMDALVHTAAGTSLAMSGALTGGFALTKVGAGTLVLSGGANTYSGATSIEGGVLSVSSLANAGSPSDLGAYATPGAAGIVVKGGTLQYTGSSMGAAIDRGITITADSTVDLPITGDLRLGALGSSVGAFRLNVTGSGAGNSRLYIDSVAVPNSTFRREGPVFTPTTANVTIGSITGNGNFQMQGSASSTDNIITGPINLGRGHFDPNSAGDHVQVFGPITAGNVWTIMGENTFDGRWYAAQGAVKIKSPGTLVGSQNVSYAFGRADDSVSWPGGNDRAGKFYNGNTVVELLNDLSTSYQYKPGHRVSVRAGGSNATFNVGPQGAATGQTHNLGPLWIHDNNMNVNVNAIGGSDYGLTFDAVTLRDGQTANIVANTTLTLASFAKGSGGGTSHLRFRGTGTTTVTGSVPNPGGTLNITKEHNGTLILQGDNTYTGTTTVSAGTLSLVGGSQSSPITVNDGALLAFDVDSPTTSTSSYEFIAGSKIKIIGTPTSSIELTTSSGIFGTPELETEIPGYELEVGGDGTLRLVGASLFQITNIVRDQDSGVVTLTFRSSSGATYSVDASTDLVVWEELDDSVQGQADETDYIDSSFATEPAPLGQNQVFYRVTRNP